MRDSAVGGRAGVAGALQGLAYERRGGVAVARGGGKGEKWCSKSIKNERVLIVFD